jgi:hypothetical protein
MYMTYELNLHFIRYRVNPMPQALYFQITLEPHFRHSGLATGRKILFLAEVPVSTAKVASEAPDDDQDVYKTAERLAANLTCMAMTGEAHQPGEDEMRVSFHSLPRMANDITESHPDAEKDGARVWLVGAVTE